MNPEIIGFIAGGLSSALFVPQIIKIIKEKSAEEISLVMVIIGIVSSGLWLWYGFLNDCYQQCSNFCINGFAVLEVEIFQIITFQIIT